MKKLFYLFLSLAFILSHSMCLVVAYNYRDMLCAIEHSGFSAPAGTAFIYAIPFAVLILICIFAAYLTYKKSV